MPTKMPAIHRETGQEVQITRGMYDFSPESYQLLTQQPGDRTKKTPAKGAPATTHGQQADPKEGIH